MVMYYLKLKNKPLNRENLNSWEDFLMKEKIKLLCDKITKESQERLQKQGLACQCNLDNVVAHSHIGNKYIRIDVGTSGRYMVDEEENIYGIKAYGVVNKGHYFGTLDTINNYYWGDYKAYKIN